MIRSYIYISYIMLSWRDVCVWIQSVLPLVPKFRPPWPASSTSHRWKHALFHPSIVSIHKQPGKTGRWDWDFPGHSEGLQFLIETNKVCSKSKPFRRELFWILLFHAEPHVLSTTRPEAPATACMQLTFMVESDAYLLVRHPGCFFVAVASHILWRISYTPFHNHNM